MKISPNFAASCPSFFPFSPDIDPYNFKLKTNLILVVLRIKLIVFHFWRACNSRTDSWMTSHIGVDLKIPSDLSGVTAANYEWPRADGNYKSAVGAACDSLRDVIRDLGFAGMWADRADIKDGVSYVNGLRDSPRA